MIIQRIDLENYGPYKGTVSLDLSITNNENIILIQGLNDTGKTSLYKAIKFCLYGEFSSLQYQKHVNRTKREIEDGRTSVTIIFQHNDKNYQITRSIDFKKTPLTIPDRLEIINTDFVVISNGTPESISSPDEEKRFIEYILPEEASQFFLFDGEEIQGYTQNPPKPNIKSAIEMLLGIKELLNAVDDLHRVKTIQEKKVRDELAKKEEYRGEKDDLDKLAENLAKKDSDISEMQSQIHMMQEQKLKFETQLRQFEKAKEILEQKKICEEKLETTEQDLSNTVESLRNFNDNELAVWLLIPFLKKFKDNAKTTVNSQTKQLVIDILNKKLCVCGRSLEEKSISILSDIANSETNEFQDIQNCANELLDKFGINQNKEHYLRLIQELNDFKELKNSILAEIDAKNAELGSKISSQSNEYEHIRNEYELCENNLRQRRIIAADLRTKKEEEKRQYDSRIRFLSNKNISLEYDKENKRRMLIEVILKSINEFIDEIVASRKSEIEKIASDFLKDITNAPDVYTGIEIDDEYRLHLKIKDQSTVPSWERGPSAGQSQVIAHSFIAALNRFTAKEAPIIIDTPLARLDNIHAVNIVRSYHDMGKQVIVLYQPRELDDRLIELIRPHIRAEYDIKRDLIDIENSTITRREN
jgi:DNA sulfur modification protein DndD